MSDAPAARRGMVATSHPRAVDAGVDVLAEGGSAADAALAAAAVLCVVDARSTGIGGDAFSLYWRRGDSAPVGLAAAGVAPAAMTPAALRAAGHATMPAEGPWSITVPGAVAGWGSLHERFGRLPLARLLEPAIDAALHGFEVTPAVAEEWAATRAKLERNPSAVQAFLPHGRPPRRGERVTNPDLARALQVLATEGPGSFYKGELADAVAGAVADLGGPLRAADLGAWTGPEWVAPLVRAYRGVDVFELPPPGQGVVTLQALGIFDGLAAAGRTDEDHGGIEAMKLAFADAQAFVADPAVVPVPVAELLASPYLAARRSAIDMSAATAKPAPGRAGDTVYVAAVDEKGDACSFIQSLYEGFGSGVVVPGTGIALHNRGANFVLTEGHPNQVAPGKRPYHTIIPAMLGRGDGPFACLGVVGGFMQPQGQFQVIRNLVDRGQDPQAAVGAPRWRVTGGRTVAFEPAFDEHVVESLVARGHEAVELSRFEAGGAQLIVRSPDGWRGGSDPRKDGVARGL